MENLGMSAKLEVTVGGMQINGIGEVARLLYGTQKSLNYVLEDMGSPENFETNKWHDQIGVSERIF